MKNIVVLCGGISTERNVSIKTGNLVCDSLIRSGYNAILLDVFLGVKEKLYKSYENDINKLFKLGKKTLRYQEEIDDKIPDIHELKKRRKNDDNFDIVENEGFFGNRVLDILKASDMVFIALHGDVGENGKIQATFDLLNIKYTGTDYASSLISMDKKITKSILNSNQIKTPKEYIIDENNIETLNESIFPIVVKPNLGGSSIGVTIVKNKDGLKEAILTAKEYGATIIIEEYIKGREFSVGILGSEILPPIEIIPLQGFYDYKNKYKEGLTKEICPADISKELEKELIKIASHVRDIINLKVYARLDIIVNDKNEAYMLEINTLPGLTNLSLLPQEASAVGIDYDSLCIKILELSENKEVKY